MYIVSGSSRTPVGATTGYSTANPITGSIALNPSDTLVVLLLINANSVARAGGAPTFGGYTMLQADTSRGGATSPEIRSEMWYITASGINLPNISGSEINVPNSNTDRIAFDLVSARTGTGKTSILNVATGSAVAGTSTNPYCNITTTAGSNIIFEVVADGGNTWSPTGRTSTFTNINDNDIGNYGGGMMYSITNTVGTITGSWVFGTADDWGVVMAAFGEINAPIYLQECDHAQNTNGLLDLTYHPLEFSLVVNDTQHAQTSENVVLVAYLPTYSLILDNTQHVQTSENIVLIQHQILSINDSSHLQIANNLIVGDFPTVRGVSSNNTGTTDFTGDVGLDINVPSETVDGDVMYLSFQLTSSTGVIVAPDGWTVIQADFESIGHASCHQALFRRIASSEPASYTVKWGTITNTGRAAGAIITLSKTDTANPEMTWEKYTGSISAGSTVQLPSITANYQTLLITFVGAYTATTSGFTWTPPTDMTEKTDTSSNNATKSNAGHETSIQVVDSGATGTRTAEGSLSTLFGIGIILLANKKVNMEVQNSSHVQTSDNITLTAHEPINQLAVQDAQHIQTSDNVSLTQHQVLVVQNTIHSQTSQNVVLTQHQLLIVQNTIHTQTAGNVILIQGYLLSSNDTKHNQSSDNTILTQHQLLAANNSTHIQTADNIALIQHHLLAANHITHLQSAGDINLLQSGSITVNNVLHTQNSDNLILTQHFILVVLIATQLMNSSNVSLGVGGNIIPKVMHYIRLRSK